MGDPFPWSVLWGGVVRHQRGKSRPRSIQLGGRTAPLRPGTCLSCARAQVPLFPRHKTQPGSAALPAIRAGGCQALTRSAPPVSGERRFFSVWSRKFQGGSCVCLCPVWSRTGPVFPVTPTGPRRPPAPFPAARPRCQQAAQATRTEPWHLQGHSGVCSDRSRSLRGRPQGAPEGRASESAADRQVGEGVSSPSLCVHGQGPKGDLPRGSCLVLGSCSVTSDQP